MQQVRHNISLSEQDWIKLRSDSHGENPVHVIAKYQHESNVVKDTTIVPQHSYVVVPPPQINPYEDPRSLHVIAERLKVCKTCDKNRDPEGRTTGKWSIACDCRTCRAKAIITWECPENKWAVDVESNPEHVGVKYINRSSSTIEIIQHISAPAMNEQRGPKGWERWTNVQVAHRSALRSYLDKLAPYPGGEGTGIVICSGGKFFPTAYVTIRVIRQVGCQLPIQIWYLGRNNEKEQWMVDATAGLNVEWVDGDQVAKTYPCRILNGWELKSFAVLHAKFKEVLSLDSDSYPVQDPTYLFSDPSYLKHGAMFFPDSAHEDVHVWSSSRGIPDYRRVFRLPAVEEPTIESGQFLVDRERSWKELSAAWWLNDHSDFFYNLAYGDKESFHLAWRFCKTDYAMPSKRWTQNNPSGNHRTNWAHTMQQHDMNGNPIFYHRVGAKFQFAGKDWFMTPQTWGGIRNNNMKNEDFCWQVLEELRQMKESKRAA